MRKLLIVLLIVLLTLAPALLAQSSSEEKSIQDNSFLVEEAYNQEFGVVQHIQTFERLWQSKDWAYSFTQEWPVDVAPKNQLSYTIPVAHSGELGRSGIGDVALNYRYQLVGNGETRVAVSPRVTVLLPTGDYRREFGSGGTGVQLMLPASVVVKKRFVTHWNLGTTIIPGAKSVTGDQAATYGYTLGQSMVWLARPRVNFLLETIFNSSETVIGKNHTQRGNDVFLNPGVRWAYNFKNGLQIVPGLAVPVGFAGSSGERGLFVYLSFEHPYRKLKQ